MPCFLDTPDLHILRTFFENKQISVFPVRMETCCRSSVIFLERVPSLPSCEHPMYSDILATAAQFSIYYIAPLVLNPARQAWLNKSDTPYYHCPYTSVVYEEFVRYESGQGAMEPTDEMPQEEEQQSPRHRHPQQPVQQRGRGGGPSTHQAQNRSRRFGNGGQSAGGGFRRPQNNRNGYPASASNAQQNSNNRQNNRRFHRYVSGNNGNQNHQPNRHFLRPRLLCAQRLVPA